MSTLIVKWRPDGSIEEVDTVEDKRERERAIHALAGEGPCRHGIWKHEEQCEHRCHIFRDRTPPADQWVPSSGILWPSRQ